MIHSIEIPSYGCRIRYSDEDRAEIAPFFRAIRANPGFDHSETNNVDACSKPLKHNLILLNHGGYGSKESLKMNQQLQDADFGSWLPKVARQAYGTWSKTGKSLGLAIQQSREPTP